MACAGYSSFSPNGEYLAFCGHDGKLKIWETSTNRLKHEYVPNLHLSSPCSALGWITTSSHSKNASTTPWKKKKMKTASEDPEQKAIVAMGSANGVISLYDATSATVCGVLQDGHVGKVTALAWSAETGLFTAADDRQIIHWNLLETSIKCKWKFGKGQVTAIAIMPGGNSILTAHRIIKWWDLSKREVICSFTKQTSQITSLHCIKIDLETIYLISGACNDAYLDVWSLNESRKENTSVATLMTQEEPTSVAVRMSDDHQLHILAATRTGQAHVFKYQPNGVNAKPVKPTLSVSILSDSSQKELVKQFSILRADLTADLKMLIAYGDVNTNVHFERVVPDFTDKVQYLIRAAADSKKSKDRKEEAVSKVKITDVESNVEYLVPGLTGSTSKRNRYSTGSQLPLKNRLENLSLSDVKSTSAQVQAKGGSMVQLLIQGLHSKERSILQNVLCIKKEEVIQNTVAKLPIQAIGPLLKELTIMLQGKTNPCKIAVMWLKALLLAHTGQLISDPDMAESLMPILSLIDAKLMLLPEISRLKGRIGLVTGQITSASDKKKCDIAEDALLVYQDPDSSDEDSDVGDVDLGSESDENWAEFSDLDAQEEDDANCKSDDDVSMSS